VSQIVALAAGGTGGHLFPAQALAEALKARGAGVHLMTDERVRDYGRNFPALAVHEIPSATLSLSQPLKVPGRAMRLAVGFWKARRILRRMRPDVIVGFGGYPSLPPLLAAASLGIPVMGHVGLTPQSVHALGGHKIQGKTDAARIRLVDEAKRLEDAGVFAIVLELVTPEVAVEVTAAVHVPTVGIGAGTGCDGQILVLQDMLGLNKDFRPKFLKHFASLEDMVVDAVVEYCREVADTTFPSER
jgi:hypothetical protein